jgi:hypothetical protein
MRILLSSLALVFAGACAGNSPALIDSGRACDGTLYDHCLSEHDCGAMSSDCRNFMTDGIQVCTKTCMVGSDASCGMTLDGRAASCNMMGLCKPPGANDCVLP